jgi:peptidoglycan/xylan/chitin deacetylase (PgdA/CDA1 family)
MANPRTDLKRVLGRLTTKAPPEGVTMLIYHRVGGPGHEELDVRREDFAAQMATLANFEVAGIDAAAEALRRGDPTGRFVLTFDDGFADVYTQAWPVLRDLQLPFTVYLTSGYVGGEMRWEGSTAKEPGGPALTWDQLGEMVDSGHCTVGNHTHTHARPEHLDEDEVDRCSELIRRRIGGEVRHFAYTWGVPVPSMEPALRSRFVTAATGRLGRNLPGTDPMRLMRVPVRRSDPLEFFRAKLSGGLLAERVYAGVVATAKKAGARA